MQRRTCCLNLSVQPVRGMVDEKFAILVQNCPPGFQVTLYAHHQSDDGHSYEAFAHYCASTSGSVNVLEDPSLGGTYSGVEQMGLLWSLRQAPGSQPGLRLRKTNVLTPMEVTISVYQGHQSKDFPSLVPLASVLVERWYLAPGVRRIPVTEEGLTGTLLLPPGPGPFPGILDLWGGGGKLVEYRAALLASHGFASMAIDYMTPKITMETGKMVGNDYLETAYRVLQKHPQVLSSRIAMLGLSFGTSMALKMAVYSKVVKLSCVVCISGSHVQPVEGSVEQILAYFQQNEHKTRFNEENHVIWRDMLLPIPTDPKLKVDMKEMMERSGNSHLLTVLSYPNAGHLIEPPYTPHFRFTVFKTVMVQQKTMALWGGATPAHAQAQEDSWRKILCFLRHNLYGTSLANP